MTREAAAHRNLAASAHQGNNLSSHNHNDPVSSDPVNDPVNDSKSIETRVAVNLVDALCRRAHQLYGGQ